MKKTWLVLSMLAFVLVACGAVEDMSQAVQDAGIDTSLKMPQKQSERLIASGSCPVVEVVEDLAMLHEFVNEKDPMPSSMISSADMKKVQSSCAYGLKSVTVDLKLEVESKMGPQGKAMSREPFFSYPFFVAVTSPSGEILAKEVFAASMTYEIGKDKHYYTEELRQIIPTDSRYEGSKYKVLIGFQLSDDQLQFNRQMLRGLKGQPAEPKAVQKQASDQ